MAIWSKSSSTGGDEALESLADPGALDGVLLRAAVGVGGFSRNVSISGGPPRPAAPFGDGLRPHRLGRERSPQPRPWRVARVAARAPGHAQWRISVTSASTAEVSARWYRARRYAPRIRRDRRRRAPRPCACRRRRSPRRRRCGRGRGRHLGELHGSPLVCSGHARWRIRSRRRARPRSRHAETIRRPRLAGAGAEVGDDLAGDRRGLRARRAQGDEGGRVTVASRPRRPRSVSPSSVSLIEGRGGGSGAYPSCLDRTRHTPRRCARKAPAGSPTGLPGRPAPARRWARVLSRACRGRPLRPCEPIARGRQTRARLPVFEGGERPRGTAGWPCARRTRSRATRSRRA